MQTTSFGVPSITCNICSDKIQNGLKDLEGIGKVSVDLTSKVVNVDYDPNHLQPIDIKKKVSDMGYEVR